MMTQQKRKRPSEQEKRQHALFKLVRDKLNATVLESRIYKGLFPTMIIAAVKDNDKVYAICLKGNIYDKDTTIIKETDPKSIPHYPVPKKMLELLSPTDNPYALAWREKCNLYHKTLKALKTDNFIIYKRVQDDKIHLCKYLSVGVSLISFNYYGSDRVFVIRKPDLLTRDFTILDINENSPVEDMVRYIGQHKDLDTLIKEKLEQRRTYGNR